MVSRTNSEYTYLTNLSIVIAAVILFANSHEILAHNASLKNLGNLPEPYTSSNATAVSSDGSVIVGGVASPTLGFRSFRWTEKDGMQLLDPDSYEEFDSRAYGISADGLVVVGRNINLQGAGRSQYRWSAETGMVNIGGDPDGVGKAVTADGSVVYGWGVIDSRVYATRWTQADGMISLGDLPGGIESSLAWFMSGDGQTVVGYGHSLYGQEAFRWTQSEGMLGLGDLNGGLFYSWAKSASQDGSVIVGVSESAQGQEAFRWTLDGGMQGLGDLPGGSFRSAAHGVTQDGSIIVGTASTNQGNTAMIWTQNTGIRSVAEMLAEDYDLDTSGWHLQEASAISADGTTIVGYGKNPLNKSEAWVIQLSSRVHDGDVNHDGLVDIRDMLAGLRILNGFSMPTSHQLTHGDVAPLINGLPNPDGAFNIADLLLIVRKANGLVDY